MSSRADPLASTIDQAADASRRVHDDFAEQVSASQQTSASTGQNAASAQEPAGTSEELAQLVARLETVGVAYPQGSERCRAGGHVGGVDASRVIERSGEGFEHRNWRP
jgi:ABC-type transporter Mla subunit MlaD